MPLGCPASCNQTFQSIHESIGLSDRSSDRSSLIPARRKLRIGRLTDPQAILLLYAAGSVYRPIQEYPDRSARPISSSLIGRLTDQWASVLSVRTMDRSADRSITEANSLFAHGSVSWPIQRHNPLSDRSVDRSEFWFQPETLISALGRAKISHMSYTLHENHSNEIKLVF